MGLDGISVNQLRITPDNNSSELNNAQRFAPDTNLKIVDGLHEGQKVDPDRQNEHEKPKLNKQYTSQNEEEDDQNSDVQEVIKYDLSKNDKYILSIDESSNSILIIEKATKNVVQTISPDELSQLINYLSYSQGSIINRKF